jgi:hypothetical protein
LRINNITPIKMKQILSLSGLFVFMLVANSCKDNNETVKPTEKDKILINYPWRMSTVTDLSGNVIATNKLNDQTQAIGKYMDIQFLQNNVTKALDRSSSQVINGGTWYLKDESKTLDINVVGFVGQFGVEELTNSKLRLKSKMPVSGVEQETIMVFDPVVK